MFGQSLFLSFPHSAFVIVYLASRRIYINSLACLMSDSNSSCGSLNLMLIVPVAPVAVWFLQLVFVVPLVMDVSLDCFF